MDRMVFLIMIMVFQISHLAWGGSYLIQLKNGGEVRTSGYWEEGDEIKFYIYEGMAGVKKDFVNGIKETNIVLHDHFEKRRSSSYYGEKETTKQGIMNQNQVGESSTQADNSMIDVDYYQQKKQAIRQRMEEVSQEFEEASRRRDAEAKEKARQERIELSKQLIDLTEELTRKNNGVRPDWWR
ncbi:MAG TPA: hypothetical protein VNP04_12265 [Alphaproteobacteria bacterium]|nr:hypothetical protein [Alphaproteobacteria bacterium]